MDPINAGFSKSPLAKSEAIPKLKHESVKKQGAKIWKGREAEDVIVSKRPLARQVSAHQLQRSGAVLTKAEEIARKSGELWECIDRKPNASGGYIYIFKLKSEYDDVTPHRKLAERKKNLEEKLAQIYPAIEPTGTELDLISADDEGWIDKRAQKIIESSNLTFLVTKTIWNLIRNQVKSLMKEKIEEKEILRKLGFESRAKSDGVYLNLPDREAFLARYEKLRKIHHFPPIDIASADGIADDMAYIESYFKHDVLLSSDKEFVHDSSFHLLNTALFIIRSANEGQSAYEKERARLVKLVAQGYRRIMIAKKMIDSGETGLTKDVIALIKNNMEKIETSVAALADSIAATASPARARTINEESLLFVAKEIWGNTVWKKYGERRFGSEVISSELLNIWLRIISIETTFDFWRKNPPSISPDDDLSDIFKKAFKR